MDFGLQHNTPIAPVHTPQTVIGDPQFQDRLPWIPASRLDADMLPFPARFGGSPDGLEPPTKAPGPGQHTDDVLAEVAGYGRERIESLRSSGAAQ